MPSTYKENINEIIESYDGSQNYCDKDPDIHVEYPGSALAMASNKKSSGFEIPGFNKLIKSGALLPYTPWEQFQEQGIAHMDRTVVYNQGTTCTHKDIPSYGALRISEATTREYAAEIDFSGYVQSAAAAIYESGHDTLTFVAEFHKIIEMFMHTGRTLLRLLQTGNPAKTWLEYRYGWRILYYDVIDIVKAINSIDDSRTRFKQRTGGSYGKIYTGVLAGMSTAWGGWDEIIPYTDKVSASVRGSVVADIDPPTFRFNPATTAWELVRFSFIIDWIIGIGQWIASNSFLIFARNYVAAGGILMNVDRYYGTPKAIPRETTILSSYEGSVDGYSSMEYTLRVPTSVSLLPQFTFKVDVFKVLDLLSLIFGSRKLR